MEHTETPNMNKGTLQKIEITEELAMRFAKETFRRDFGIERPIKDTQVTVARLNRSKKALEDFNKIVEILESIEDYIKNN